MIIILIDNTGPNRHTVDVEFSALDQTASGIGLTDYSFNLEDEYRSFLTSRIATAQTQITAGESAGLDVSAWRDYEQALQGRLLVFATPGAYTEIIEPTLPNAKIRFSSNVFMDRFPDGIEESIIAQIQNNPAIGRIYYRAIAADFVDVTDPQTIAGVDALIAAGLVDATDRDVILAPEVM